MSAIEISETHVDALLTAGIWLQLSSGGPVRWFYPSLESGGPTEYEQKVRYLTPETAGRVGAVLLAENRHSVNHLYEKEDWEPPYLFRELPGRPNPVRILKALDCYEYQTCEHPEWPQSEAFVFCQALRREMIKALPGYQEAEWQIHDRQMFRD